MLIIVSSFHFWSSFHFCIFIPFLYLHFIFWSSFVDVLHFVVVSSFTFTFRTSSLTLPWTIAGFLHPFYTFNPAHHRVIRDIFMFQLFLLPASATVLSEHFLTHRRFYLMLLHRHFNLHLYQGFPGSRQFLKVCRASWCFFLEIRA